MKLPAFLFSSYFTFGMKASNSSGKSISPSGIDDRSPCNSCAIDRRRPGHRVSVESSGGAGHYRINFSSAIPSNHTSSLDLKKTCPGSYSLGPLKELFRRCRSRTFLDDCNDLCVSRNLARLDEF